MVDEEEPTISDIVGLLGNERNVVLIATLQPLVSCMAGDADLCRKLACSSSFLRILLKFANKSVVETCKNANATSTEFHRIVFKSLVGLTCDDFTARTLLRFQEHAFVIRGCKRLLFDMPAGDLSVNEKCYDGIDVECVILSNITREAAGAEVFLKELDCSNAEKTSAEGAKVRDVIDVLLEHFAPAKTSGSALYRYPHFLYMLANLSQLVDFRRRLRDCVNVATFACYLELLERYVPIDEDEEKQILLPFAQLLRNLSLDSEMHAFLLKTIKIVPYVLFPLYDAAKDDIGFDDEVLKLDLRLQFLPETKRRGKSPALKQCLLECLYQLSSTREGRKVLHDAGTYLILREFHRHDNSDARCVFTCENLVDVLIRDEEDFDAVPDIRAALNGTETEPAAVAGVEDIHEKLEKLNEELLQNAEELVRERNAAAAASVAAMQQTEAEPGLST